MNVPNVITVFRILLIPVLVAVLLSSSPDKEIIALVIFIIAALSDMADGVWARRKEQTTTLGEFLDPIADKLLVSSVLICLVELDVVAAWIVIVIIAREIFVTGFRAIAASRGVNIPSFRLGKFKMWCEAIAIAFLIGRRFLGPLDFLAPLGLWVVVVVALISAAEYFIKLGPRVFSSGS